MKSQDGNCTSSNFCADGFYYPFLIAFLYEMEGILAAGVGLGIITVMDSLGSYFVGGLVDRYGRKPFLVVSAMLGVGIYLAYPLPERKLHGAVAGKLIFFTPSVSQNPL